MTWIKFLALKELHVSVIRISIFRCAKSSKNQTIRHARLCTIRSLEERTELIIRNLRELTSPISGLTYKWFSSNNRFESAPVKITLQNLERDSYTINLIKFHVWCSSIGSLAVVPPYLRVLLKPMLILANPKPFIFNQRTLS